jgi:hypothetical protein
MRAKQYSSVPLSHLYIGACMYIECARDGFVHCALYAYRACARWLCSIVRVSVAACARVYVCKRNQDARGECASR